MLLPTRWPFRHTGWLRMISSPTAGPFLPATFTNVDEPPWMRRCSTRPPAEADPTAVATATATAATRATATPRLLFLIVPPFIEMDGPAAYPASRIDQTGTALV